MTDVKKLIARRGVLKAHLTRFEDFINKCKLEQEYLEQIQPRIDAISKIYTEFDQIQSEIEGSEEQSLNHEIERSSFENKYFKLISQAKMLPSSSSSTTSVFSSSKSINSTCDNLNIKLPHVNLPEFSGSYDNWLSFHDTFEALIHNNSRLSNTQKQFYLKSCLKGEAAKVIQSVSISDSNYAIAWDLIVERYSNKKAIISTHIKNIFELPNIGKDVHLPLRSFLDSFLSNYRALEKLGENVSQWNTILIYMLNAKLDYQSKREWEINIQQNQSPKIDDFTKFLRERCNLLDSINSKTNTTMPVKGYISTKTHTHLITNKISCPICKGSHFIYACQNFLKMSVNDRYSQIKKLNLCTNCLRSGHGNENCRLNNNCRICNKRHNTLLHIRHQYHNQNDNHFTHQSNSQSNINQQVNNSASNKSVTETDNQNDQIISNSEINSITCQIKHQDINSYITSKHMQNSVILLSTALIYAYNHEGKLIPCRALLDNGSQSSFATTHLIRKLGLPINKINLPVSGIGLTTTNITKQSNIKIKSIHTNYKSEISCLITDNNITNLLPSAKINTSHLKIPQHIKLADAKFNQPSQIDILLGAGIFFELLNQNQIKLNQGPTLQDTKLGWIITGHIPILHQYNSSQKCFHTLNSDVDIDNQLKRFWEIEENHISLTKTNEEMECEQHFIQNLNKDNTGRFVVKLPLKENADRLGDSLQYAMKRFYALERKFSKCPNFKQNYINFITEYKELGHMSKINHPFNSVSSTYYLPHHGVEKIDSLTTKLRVVFDASAKTTSGLSLNNILKVGPTVQSDLFLILINFRQHNIVLLGDIEKMYRQVTIHETQRDLQRIIWRKNPNDQFEHFQLNTVTYGTASAPFLATRCIKQLAIENYKKFPIESEIIMNDFYVDDLITGSNNINNVLNIHKNITQILKGAGMELRKVTSNNNEVLNHIADIKGEHVTQHSVLNQNSMKTLGIVWNRQLDVFEYNIKNKNYTTNITKRTILSYISQIFDPLGLLGPIIVQAKLIMQKLWQLQLDWDAQLPHDLHNICLEFYSQMKQTETVQIPRQILTSNPTNIQLHGFADASEKAYGIAIYVKCNDECENTKIQLICSKSRVAPLKTITLPKLELCGALLLAQIMKKLIKCFKNNKINQIYYWTDSTIVLSWLSAQPNTWQTFVRNRVSEIQQLSNINNWFHVPSKLNPADIISRGMKIHELIYSTLWWNGSPLLLQESDTWSDFHISKYKRNHNELPEFKNNIQSFLLQIDSFNIFTKYSSYIKLQRIFAFILRFINNCRSKQNKQFDKTLTNLELNHSIIKLVQICQGECFVNEIKSLKTTHEVQRCSKIASLNPFIDKNGIIRVGGRLQNADIPYDHKHPMLLPPKHNFTYLIIRFYHELTLHSGPQTTLFTVRQKFWPINGKQITKQIVKKCIKCFKTQPVTQIQQMGQLPSMRVNPAQVFKFCGVDYAGPFKLKETKFRNKKFMKGYICIFICMTSKSIHLELATELTTDCFLNALKRFVSRRGLCRKIYSDNGTNFQGANKSIQEINTILKNEKFTSFLNKQQIDWNFIPTNSPHMGGLWEAGIKSIKFHLKRVANQNLTYEEFYTLLTQIEAVLNSRPLFAMSIDPNDLEALTPGHLLIGEPLISVPDINLQDVPIKYLSRYQHLCKITRDFWSRWSKDYLNQLQQRNKWKFKKEIENLIGTLILIKEDNIPPQQWRMGRILEIYPGKDGFVRVVLIKTQGGNIKRSINKICILPFEQSC